MRRRLMAALFPMVVHCGGPYRPPTSDLAPPPPEPHATAPIAPAPPPPPAPVASATPAKGALSSDMPPDAGLADPPASAAPPARGKSSGARGDKVAARHVLVQWMGCERAAESVVRTRDQARVVIDQVLARARAGEDFSRLVAEYSDEKGAAGRGGSLGKFGRGVMHPLFEEAAFSLQPGEISGIIETSFGFHVIQRTE